VTRSALPDRLLALALLVLAAGAALSAQGLEVAFAADPVGPRAFPTAVALVLAACALLIGLRPETVWQRAERRLPGPIVVAAMAGYAVALAPLGFMPATALLCLVVALAFGAGPVRALLVGAVTAPALWLLLDRMLDLPLPRGVLGI
jgi:putative tricarboxylic transport membrane protein